MRKVLFYSKFISCLYMFRVLETCRDMYLLREHVEA